MVKEIYYIQFRAQIVLLGEEKKSFSFILLCVIQCFSASYRAMQTVTHGASNHLIVWDQV